MKRRLLTLLIVSTLCLLAAGSGAEEPKRVMNFIAVMDLNCGTVITKDECSILTDIVIEEIVKTNKYTVIDRANRDKILAEVGFQQTGCVDESCSVEAGQMLGVGKLVIGKINKLGSTYIVSLQLINVQTGAVEISESEKCKCEIDGLIDAVINASRKLMGQTVATSQPQPQPQTGTFTHMQFVEIGKAVKSKNRARLIELLEETPGLVNSRAIKTSYSLNVFPGSTPLHVAAVKCRPEMAKLLLERGADPKLVNFRGLNAYKASSCKAVKAIIPS